jgi:5-(carboxyamino)imidazole ribonucleotide mutase
MDALLSIVQMPAGIPVACMAINGAKNAGLFAAQILATSSPSLQRKFRAYRKTMVEQVEKKAQKLAAKLES